MAGTASDLSRQLARNAESVCRHYLAAGRREGRYWIAGDVHGSKGRSLYVRLKGGEHGKGAAGKWTDAATGDHGDLLDLIGLNCGHRLLSDTLDEPDLEDLAWGIVNVFHRAGERIERELDDNEREQKRLQREQDGSEVKSVELERRIAEGITMLERRDTMEFLRDTAADQFRTHIRKAWLPRSGAMVNRKMLTSAVLDSRRQIDKRAYQDARVLSPDGVQIAFTGGADFNDHKLIYATLDKVHAQLPDMILLHGATPTGAERIAACWARDRNVPQKPYKPDWERHKKAAPFKRNDAMLEEMPRGVIIFPGTGIQDNLADKARKMGIRLWDFRGRTA